MLEENSDSPYASPIILVKKKPDPNDPEGKIRLRFCTDNRRCNRLVLENVVFPAASMDASVREAGSGSWFTTFDISNAYHTVPLAPESRPITAFIYNGSGEFAGVYQYRNLNQGGALSPQLFVNTVRKALGPVFRDMTIVYHIDDFMIASETLEQHVVDVTKFMHAALRIDMSFDIKKCRFLKREIDWCGFRFSGGTYRPSPDRLKCLDNITFPDISFHRPKEKIYSRLLGLLNYFRAFCKDWSKKQTRMVTLVSEAWAENIPFAEAQEECDKITREAIESIKAASLEVVTEGESITIMTDASGTASGFVVMRTSDKRPIMFGGKGFTRAERSYGSFERELFAIRLALDKAAHHIARAGVVTLESDNLTSILNMQGAANQITARALRILLEIRARTGPNIKFTHVKGILNVVSDALSRYAYVEENVPLNPESKAVTAAKIAGATDEQVVEVVGTDGRMETYAVTTRAATKLYEQVRKIHRETHTGVIKLYKTCQELGLKGAGLKSICSEICRECSYCNTEVRVLAENVLGMTGTEERELKTICIDHMYMPTTANGNSFILTVLDPFSKYLCAVAVPALTMQFVLVALQVYLTIFGSVEMLRADRAFFAYSIQQLCEMYNIELNCFASHNSRSNNVERSHRTIRELTAAFLTEQKLEDSQWDRVLHRVVRSINSTINHTTGQIPHKVIFNAKPVFPGLEPEENAAILDRRREIYDKIVASKEVYASKNPIPVLPVNTNVIIRYHAKARPMYGVVLEDDGSLTALVKKFGVRNQHEITRIPKRFLYLRRYPMPSVGENPSEKEPDMDVCLEPSV